MDRCSPNPCCSRVNYDTVSKPLYILIKFTEFAWILSVYMHSWGGGDVGVYVVLYSFCHVWISVTTTIMVELSSQRSLMLSLKSHFLPLLSSSTIPSPWQPLLCSPCLKFCHFGNVTYIWSFEIFFFGQYLFFVLITFMVSFLLLFC